MRLGRAYVFRVDRKINLHAVLKILNNCQDFHKLRFKELRKEVKVKKTHATDIVIFAVTRSKYIYIYVELYIFMLITINNV